MQDSFPIIVCQISMLATLVHQIFSFTSSTRQFYESNQFRPPFKIQSIRQPFSFSVGYGFSRPYHIGLSGGLMENPTYYELLLASKFSFFLFFSFFFFFSFSFAFVLLSCKVGFPFLYISKSCRISFILCASRHKLSSRKIRQLPLQVKH